MNLKLIGTFILAWIILFMILPSFVLPGFYFIKVDEQNTPLIKETANELKLETKEETLRNIYNFQIDNYNGANQRYKFILNYGIFSQNVDKFLLDKGRFMACHQHNKMTKELLLNTNQFSNEDIETKIALRPVSIHQYLIVNTGDKKFKIDPFYKILEEVE